MATTRTKRSIQIVHWSRACVNSSVSGQLPCDKTSVELTKLSTFSPGNWKLFHLVPLISPAVACLVELKAALQQGSRLLKLANLPKQLNAFGLQAKGLDTASQRLQQAFMLCFAARVSFEGFGMRGLLERRTAPVFVQGCFRVLVGTSEVGSRKSVRGSLSAFVVRGFRNAISFKSTDLCYVGSCSCSGVDFVCVSGPKTSPGNPNGGPCSRRSRISDCVVCRKDGSLYIGL